MSGWGSPVSDIPIVRDIPVVLDTNIVLDLWLYQDPATPALREALATGAVKWLSTPAMRD